MICVDNDEGDLPTRQALLGAYVPVSGNHDLKPCSLRSVKEPSVRDPGPTHLGCGSDLEPGQQALQTNRDIFIQ
jgi:hypothetical protein